MIRHLVEKRKENSYGHRIKGWFNEIVMWADFEDRYADIR